MQAGGGGLAAEFLDLLVEVAGRGRGPEDRRGEFGADQDEPVRDLADSLRGCEGEDVAQRGGGGVEGAGPEPDDRQVDARERLAADPVLLAWAGPVSYMPMAPSSSPAAWLSAPGTSASAIPAEQ